jgi:hypothetical protein
LSLTHHFQICVACYFRRLFYCVIPSVAEGPRIFLDAGHFDFTSGTRSRAAPNPLRHSELKSSHAGFIDSISLIFFARVHPFSCFSREIAVAGSANSSNQTSR